MPMTTGQPERSKWGGDWDSPSTNPFAQDAVALRGYLVFPGDLDEEPVEPERQPGFTSEPSEPRRSGRSLQAARAAVADAMGVDVDSEEIADLDFDDLTDIIRHDLTDSRAALDALDVALAYPGRRGDREKANPGTSDGTYVAREGNWRERNGMPRKRTSVPPSRTPEARRLRHLQRLVEQGKHPDIATAERMTQRRQVARRKSNAGTGSPDAGVGGSA